MATDGVERIELEEPRGALLGAGARTVVLSLHDGEIEARRDGHRLGGHDPCRGPRVRRVRRRLDALLLPGGTVNPDKLRMDGDAVAFVKEFVESGKPVAAICHGPWTLAEADVVRGHRLTSWPSSAPTCATRARTWSTRRSSSTATDDEPLAP